MAGRSPLDPARDVALGVLKSVRVDDAYANLALSSALADRGLSGRDAAFATELASGTLRGLATYDAIIGACAERPVGSISAKVLDALRMGVHQLLATRVPAHAAVDTTVRWVRHEAGPGAAGFANAVLRKAQSHTLDEWRDQLGAHLSPTEALALRHSHPQWIVEALTDALGERGGEIEALLIADNEPAGVTLVARPGLIEPGELPGAAGRWSPYAVHLEGGDPAGLAPVRDGRAGVQDEGSQLVALALAQAPIDGPDGRWLDLCAGPGGKAALLGALARQRGARLTAVEPSAHRAELVRRVVDDSVEVVVADGRASGLAEGTFDRVLVDAPCTGLGALRRRPEARWRKAASDVTGLATLQGELLAAAVALTRPGGVIAYATCSPHLSETRAVIDDAVASGGVTVVDAGACLPQVTDGEGPIEGTLQLWPHRHATDAMFIALLRKAGPEGGA